MRQLIGDKKFYKMILLIALPIMIQNGVTNFVSLLDNIMVGQIGTASLSGVAIVNQLIFVVNLCIFGGISGPGIFTAQFFGQGNTEGIRETFRFKFIICFFILAISLSLLAGAGSDLIELYLHGDKDKEVLLETLVEGENYLKIMIIGIVPFAISQVYSSTLREVGETVIPMKASIAAVAVNMCFNYILIFGKLGMPVLGVAGAAIATVIARFVECGIVIFWTHKHYKKYPFIQGAYKNFHISLSLVKSMLIKGLPLLLNEGLWAAGITTLNQYYSIRGIDVVAGLSISSVIANLFNIVFMALGCSVSIIVGPLLGAGKMEEAKDTAYKMITFSVMVCIVIGSIMALMAPLFPMLYKTTDEVKYLATQFIRISALCMPMFAYLHATYFTLRTGGRTYITFLFDSIYLWLISVPVVYLVVKYTGFNILIVYFIGQMIDIIKSIIGFIMLKKGIWLRNIVKEFD